MRVWRFWTYFPIVLKLSSKKCFVNWFSSMFFLLRSHLKVPLREFFKWILQKNPLKESFKRNIQKSHWKQSFKRILYTIPSKESLKRIIQKNHSKESFERIRLNESFNYFYDLLWRFLWKNPWKESLTLDTYLIIISQNPLQESFKPIL